MHERKYDVRKRLVCLMMMIAVLLCLLPVNTVKADETKELNIYAMYLGDEDKGDSVLLESKGHYLLVDIGSAASAAEIIRQLKKLQVTNVDVMLSHLHNDHIGGNEQSTTAGLEKINAAGIMVDTLYLPSTSMAQWSQRFPQRNLQLQQFMQRQGGGNVVYLNLNSTVQFGDVTGKVIGPINSWKRSPNQYTKYSSQETRYINYENDSSLAVIFTCGNTRYFTAGDCYGDEAKELVDAYGKELRCDIMKLCHHGIGSGNSADLMKAVRPKYSFVPNSGVANVSETTGRWRSYTATKRASEYGMCYMIGSEARTIIYHIVNDRITLYHGTTVSEDKKMTGWQSLYGADGVKRELDVFYFDDECTPAKGIMKIGDHYYRFKPGGQMDFGSLVAGEVSEGWKAFSKGDRYYRFSDDETVAYVSCGFDTVDGLLYYFDKDGYRIKGSLPDAVELRKIGSAYYAMDENGVITTGDWEEIDDAFYYFSSDGSMIRNCKYKVGDSYYLFDENGAMMIGEFGTELYEFGNDTYAVRADGTLVAGKIGSVGGDTYYFNNEGIIQKNKIVKLKNKEYYFDKDGKLVCDRNFELNGKKYHSNEKGIISAVGM